MCGIARNLSRRARAAPVVDQAAGGNAQVAAQQGVVAETAWGLFFLCGMMRGSFHAAEFEQAESNGCPNYSRKYKNKGNDQKTFDGGRETA